MRCSRSSRAGVTHSSLRSTGPTPTSSPGRTTRSSSPSRGWPWTVVPLVDRRSWTRTSPADVMRIRVWLRLTWWWCTTKVAKPWFRPTTTGASGDSGTYRMRSGPRMTRMTRRAPGGGLAGVMGPPGTTTRASAMRAVGCSGSRGRWNKAVSASSPLRAGAGVRHAGSARNVGMAWGTSRSWTTSSARCRVKNRQCPVRPSRPPYKRRTRGASSQRASQSGTGLASRPPSQNHSPGATGGGSEQAMWRMDGCAVPTSRRSHTSVPSTARTQHSGMSRRPVAAWPRASAAAATDGGGETRGSTSWSNASGLGPQPTSSAATWTASGSSSGRPRTSSSPAWRSDTNRSSQWSKSMTCSRPRRMADSTGKGSGPPIASCAHNIRTVASSSQASSAPRTARASGSSRGRARAQA